MNIMKSLCSLVNFKASWGTRKLKVCMHETMIIMGGIMATIEMMITMRGVVTMMMGYDSIKTQHS